MTAGIIGRAEDFGTFSFPGRPRFVEILEAMQAPMMHIAARALNPVRAD